MVYKPISNTPVCTLPGSSTEDFQSIEDGMGGTYIVWVDARYVVTLNLYIFAQHIDSNGVALWGANGIPISNNYNSTRPRIVLDKSNGGCIISWTEEHLSKSIKLQRLTSSGVKKWVGVLDQGIQVSENTITNYENMSMVSNGVNGGVICFYYTQ
ncbi:MAG: hypothetical protein IPN26_09070 [Bacteroidetes bacterium]|nr:hypothetical protein [Bacteroidota bacterium]